MKISFNGYWLLLLACLFLVACGSSSDSTPEITIDDNTAIINTVAADFSDANIEFVDLSAETLIAQEANYGIQKSDFRVATFNNAIYRIGRLNIDRVIKYSLDDIDEPVYSYSTIDTPESPTNNPYGMAFVSEQKAYLYMHSTNQLWIVNPSAPTEAEFKIGTIDLSHYNDGDTNGAIEMSSAVIVEGKLFLTLQRLSGFCPALGESMVVVIDINTDQEIDTQTSEGIKAIRLATVNPFKVVYQQGIGVVVQSFGHFGNCKGLSAFNGGLEVISPDTYDSYVLLDDGVEPAGTVTADELATAIPYGNINDVAIVDVMTGYFVGYQGFGNTQVYKFNPLTGVVDSAAVAEFKRNETFDIQSITFDSKGQLWVGVGESDEQEPRIVIVDPATNEVVDTIVTTSNPQSVVFATAILPAE